MKTHYGGQALIEGVLIRGRSGVFAAVRAPDGRLVTREEPLSSGRRGKLARLPVIRGILALGETLAIGTRMLMFSADVAAGGSGESLGPMGTRAIAGAALVTAGAFAAAPSLLASSARRRFGHGERAPGLRTDLVEGGIRMGILLAYLGAISRIGEVQRIFAYHGAEHKSISALEAGAALEPASVQQFDTAHPRCGTAFLLQSMLTSTAIYSIIGKRAPLGRVGTRVALIPLVAGISYEVLQFNARHLESAAVKILNAPGMLMQRLTTREPTDDQVEVAIHALQGAMAMDQRSA
jgi:uncharacterized protein YqhQ